MSLYICLDLIEQELRNLEKKSNSFWRTFLSQSLPQASYHFLQELKTKFEHIKDDENYEKEDLANFIKDIEDHRKKTKEKIPTSTRKIMEKILFDLKLIQQKYEQSSQPTSDTIDIPPEVKQIAKINQGKLPKLGISPGECLGFTYSMADPNLSPFAQEGLKIDLNQTIHDYQKWQVDRGKDQQTIKRSRLTRFYFCPDPTKQAKKILNEVEKNQNTDKHLKLCKKGAVGKHACYLSIRKDGKIWYMDPNEGAFSFAKKEDFINFYANAAQRDKATGADYRFFNLDELRYEKNSAERKTWGGILRTLITGPKYLDNWYSANRFIMLSYAVGAGVGGALLGAALGSVIPVPILGTIFGISVGALMGSTVIGAALGVTLGAGLCKLAFSQNHYGLLAVPHFLMDQWQDIKEGLSNLLSHKPSYKAPAREAPKQTSDSTKQILFKIRSANSEVQNIGQIKPLEKGKEEQAEPNLVSIPEPALDSEATPSLRLF